MEAKKVLIGLMMLLSFSSVSASMRLSFYCPIYPQGCPSGQCLWDRDLAWDMQKGRQWREQDSWHGGLDQYFQRWGAGRLYFKDFENSEEAYKNYKAAITEKWYHGFSLGFCKDLNDDMKRLAIYERIAQVDGRITSLNSAILALEKARNDLNERLAKPSTDPNYPMMIQMLEGRITALEDFIRKMQEI